MSITLIPPTSANQFATAPNMPPRIPLTRQHYYPLFDAGLMPEKCALMNGGIIEKMPQRQKHTLSLRRMTRSVRRIFGEDHVYSQSPSMLGVHDGPEPDVFVTTQPDTSIEISLSTLDFDKGKKASRYAVAGATDYWVVDVENRRLLVFRNPVDGVYPVPQELDETQNVLPNATITVADLLP